MRSPFLRAMFGRLPPVARRDQRIADLTNQAVELEQTRARLFDRASFHVRLAEERRLRALEVEVGAPSRSVIAGGKFHVYDLVRSHGVDVPEQFGRWDDPADIAWADLPDAVVVKSAFGAASRGVLPLRRVGGGWQVVTQDETATDDELTAELRQLVEMGTVRPPFGAEEFLDDGTGRPPVDVKVYAFYGEAPLVMLNSVAEHGNPGSARLRFIGRDGADLIDVTGPKMIDPTIAIPDALPEIFTVAERVSRVIRAPFSRIDLYDIKGRIVFGEVTPRPGMTGRFGPTLDMTLGEAWERAQVRLWRDLAAGMSPEPEWGPAQE